MQIYLPSRKFRDLYSLNFDGVDARLQIPDNAFNSFADGTIAMSVKFDSVGNDLFNCVENINNRFQFFIFGGKIRVFCRLTAGIKFWREGSTTLSSGTWYRISFSKSGTTILIYVNGVAETLTDLLGSTTDFFFDDISASSGGNTYYNLGAYYDGATGSNFLDGKMDEVRFWNTGLNGTQLTEDYTLYKADARLLSTYSSLVSHYHMGDYDTYSTINDNKTTNHATMINMIAGDIQTDVP